MPLARCAMAAGSTPPRGPPGDEALMTRDSVLVLSVDTAAPPAAAGAAAAAPAPPPSSPVPHGSPAGAASAASVASMSSAELVAESFSLLISETVECLRLTVAEEAEMRVRLMHRIRTVTGEPDSDYDGSSGSDDDEACTTLTNPTTQSTSAGGGAQRSPQRQKKGRENWKSDASAPACDACAVLFGIFRRRHHCRRCGGVFCNNCAGTFVMYTPDSRKGEEGYQQKRKRLCKKCISDGGGSSASAASPGSSLVREGEPTRSSATLPQFNQSRSSCRTSASPPSAGKQVSFDQRVRVAVSPVHRPLRSPGRDSAGGSTASGRRSHSQPPPMASSAAGSATSEVCAPAVGRYIGRRRVIAKQRHGHGKVALRPEPNVESDPTHDIQDGTVLVALLEIGEWIFVEWIDDYCNTIKGYVKACNINTVIARRHPSHGHGVPSPRPGVERRETPACDLKSFLAEARLTQFADALAREGYDDMATLTEIDDRELTVLGMGMGHVRRFRVALKQWRVQRAVSCRKMPPTPPSRSSSPSIQPPPMGDAAGPMAPYSDGFCRPHLCPRSPRSP